MNNMGFEEAKFKAIKYIGISKKTRFEVMTKLKNMYIEDKIINKVLDYLIELNYINDLDYVDSYIRQNIRLEKYSIFEITEKLKIKGINQSIVDDRIDKLLPSDYEDIVIRKITNIKSKTLDNIKLKQYLYRRGFKNI